MSGRDDEDLLELMNRFLSGRDRSRRSAAEIEAIVLECFDDEPWFDDVSLALASYVPGGRGHYFDEEALAAELRPVAQALHAKLAGGVGRATTGTFSTPAGTVHIDRDGTVSVGQPPVCFLEVPGFKREDEFIVYATDSWICVVGLTAKELVVARPGRREIAIVGQLDRLDFEGGYDPGGLHRIRIVPVDDGQIVVEYELGVASVSETAGMMWDHVHDDITCVADVAGEVVRLTGETSSLALALSDGHVRFDG